jgi:broad specificity phosphatase PhoE
LTRRRALTLAVLAVLAISASGYGQVTVIFTRHAEKAAAPPKDPPLTEAGQKRADLLASMLADSGVDAIYVTEFQRTQQTAAPLAERVNIKPTVLAGKDIGPLVKAIRARSSGVVVVVGHSNTVPEIIAALGGPKFEIPDTRYDNLLVLTVGPDKSSLLRLHYGDTAPVPVGNMQKMKGAPPQ